MAIKFAKGGREGEWEDREDDRNAKYVKIYTDKYCGNIIMVKVNGIAVILKCEM